VLKRALRAWVRHLLILLPLGAAVGILAGLLFHDILFGLVVGLAIGAGFSIMFALRTQIDVDSK